VEDGEGEYTMSGTRGRNGGWRTRRWTAVEEDKGRKSTRVEGDDEVPDGGECRGEEKNESEHTTVSGSDGARCRGGGIGSRSSDKGSKKIWIGRREIIWMEGE
jgi:hypothetical protein